jgi:uncharacterized SAM-binding protein YcdF (DUF218 family)
MLRRISLWISVTGLSWFLLHSIIIIWIGLDDDVRPADVVVVLGNQVQTNGVPHPRLQSRLNRASELYRDGLAGHIIVSGGLGEEGFEEADVMREVLVRSGIPDSAVITDRQGYTTFMTARNSKAIMDIRGFRSAIVVSQYYHLARVKLAFRSFGVEQVYSVHANMGPEWREPFSIAREFLAYYYYLSRSYPATDHL